MSGASITYCVPRSNGGIATHAFHGLSETVSNPDSQTLTTTKNSQGEIVTVKDALNNTTTYSYDALGNQISVRDVAGNTVSFSYDLRGRKTQMVDPDAGTWNYTYDALSELVTQTNAKGQITSYSYDLLGRPTQRVETDLTSNWTYDTATNGKGLMATATTNQGYSRTYTYDTLSRQTQAAIVIGSGASYTIASGYDGYGRPSTTTYPDGTVVTSSYDGYGHLIQTSVTPAYVSTTTTLTALNQWDAYLHPKQTFAGNGVLTTRSYEASTGRLTGISAVQQSTNSSVQSNSYGYDSLGNVTSRGDATQGLSETFAYDALNRVTQDQIVGGAAKNFTYDAVGNLTSKTDVGSYTYGPAGGTRPHAVQSIAGSVNASYSYDANGNQVTAGGRTVTWTSFNMPATITANGKADSFTYDDRHQRVKRSDATSSTLYLAEAGIIAQLQITGAGSAWRDDLFSGGSLAGEYYWNPSGNCPVGMVNVPLFIGGQVMGTYKAPKYAACPASASSLRFFQSDMLGSVSVVTDALGAVLERDGYDTWGKRRYPNGSTDTAGALTNGQADRGYTGQEFLADSGLVHLNGRLYDPLIGRMISADPIAGEALGAQSWNRYSYVGNNPLLYTDPSGMCFLGCFWKPIFHNPIFKTVAAIGIGYFVPPLLAEYGIAGASAEVATAVNIGVAGAAAGAVATGTLKGALIGAVTAEGFNAVGDITGHTPEFGSAKFFENVAGHGLVGGLSSVAGGGQFGSGFIAAGFSDFAGGALSKYDANNVATSAISGGLGSILGGSKFENGAITGAFGYLFNEALQENRQNGLDAENERAAELQAGGWAVAQHISFIDPATQLLSFVDIVALKLDLDPSAPQGEVLKYYFEEVKTGNSPLSDNQQAVLGAIQNGTAIPGPNAAQVGLTPGIPVGKQLQSITVSTLALPSRKP